MASVSSYSTRFDHLLNTNYAPSSFELSEIRSILQEPEKKLRALEEEIQKLEIQRDELRNYVERHQLLLSPFRRIPAEVWGEIFVHALPGHLPYRTLREAPLLLTSICRSWREIALRTPRLWNSIHIHLPSPPYPLLPLVIQDMKVGVKMWLDRSGALPITFSLTILRTMGLADDELSLLATFTELLAHYSHRLKAVSLSPLPWSFPMSDVVLTPLAELTDWELPMLEDISITSGMFAWSSQNPHGWVSTALAGLVTRIRSLRTLCLSNEHIPSSLQLPLRWDGLNRLELSSPTHSSNNPVTTIVSIARLCSSLSHLKLSLSIVDGTTPIPVQQSPPQIALFRYLELEMYQDNRSQESSGNLHRLLTSTLSSILAPNLHSLILSSPKGSLYQPTAFSPPKTPFHDMLVQSQSRITYLSFDQIIIAHPNALLESFKDLPNLLSLRVRLRRVSLDSSQQLSAVGVLQILFEDSSLCPELEEVDVECHPTELDVFTVGAFVDTRPRISSFSADFGNIEGGHEEEGVISSNQVVDWLKGVRNRGIKMVWKWKRIPGVDLNQFDNPGSGFDGFGGSSRPNGILQQL